MIIQVPVRAMSRKDNCYDNAPMESFWGTLEVGNSPLEGEQFEKNHIFNYDKRTGLSKKEDLI